MQVIKMQVPAKCKPRIGNHPYVTRPMASSAVHEAMGSVVK
jgi:hypothetical protein